MSKAKTNGKPPVKVARNSSAQKQQPVPSKPGSANAIEIPFSQPDDGYCPKAITTGLSRRQGAALKSLMCGLIQRNEKCEMEGFAERGKSVEAYGHAVRWLLDRVADSWETETGERLTEIESLVW